MSSPTRSIPNASLWATAMLLAGLVLFQAGGHQPAIVQADMVTEGNGFTMLTMGGRRTARDTDVQSLVILDVSAGWLLSYELTGSRPNRQIQLLDGGPIARLLERSDSSNTSGTNSPRP